MTVVDTYTLTIERDGDAKELRPTFEQAFRVGLDVVAVLREAEENITDLLPNGYRAVITHWTGSEEKS